MAENGMVIGLDIDEKSVKFVKIKQTDSSITLLKYSVKDIPQSDDKVKSLSGVLTELFNGEKQETPVYTCAFGSNISLKRITIPMIPDEEMIEAIKWEAKNLVPFPIDKAVIDFYKIGKVQEKNTEKYDVMFAVAGEEFISFIDEVSKESAVKFTGISLIPLALSSILKRANKLEENKVCAIIDIGSEAASINLFKGDVLHFTREITVAGDSLTKSMTGLLVADHWQLNLTYEQAEEIKYKFGIPKKDTTELTDNGIPLVHIYEMMSPTLRRLQNEIQRSFDYYKETFREEKIEKLFITGGSSKLKNLDDFLSTSLGIKVEIIDPLENVKLDPSIEKEKDALLNISSRLTLSLGLAIDQSKNINFKRAKEKPRGAAFNLNIAGMLKLDKIFKNTKIAVPANLSLWGAAAVVILAISYNVYLTNVKDQYKKDLASKQMLLNDINSLIEKRAILDQISKEETHVRETMSQVTRVIPPGVVLSALTYDNAQRQIQIVGDASSTKTVGLLLKSLQDSPNFMNTSLAEARKSVVNGRPVISFKITFNLT